MKIIKIDVTPSWWRRNQFIQFIRHYFGRCEGTGMVQGPECPFCYDMACVHIVEEQAKKALPAKFHTALRHLGYNRTSNILWDQFTGLGLLILKDSITGGWFSKQFKITEPDVLSIDRKAYSVTTQASTVKVVIYGEE